MTHADTPLLDRRAVLLLLGGSVIAAACGTKHMPASATSGTNTSTNPTTGGSPSPGTTVDIGGPAVDAAHRFPADQVALAKSHYEGAWLGSWVDDRGGAGTADVIIAVDVATRMLTVTTRMTSNVFGGTAPAPTTYRIAIDSFSQDASQLALDTPQLGHVVLDPVAFRLTCSGIPQHPEIDSFRLSATVTAVTASCAYTTTGKDSKQSNGAFAWSRGGSRPPAPQIGAATALDSFLQGDYASGLVTTAELTAVFGRPATAPSPNGGRRRYQPGIDVSNAVAQSQDGHLIVQYGVYRGMDAPTAKAFYGLNASIAQPVTGLGDAAQQINSGNHFLQVLRGREVLQVSVLDTSGATPVDRLDAMAEQAAADMAPRLDHF